MIKTIPVYYCKDMDVPVEQSSPSAQKPGRAVAAWQELGIPLTIKPVRPVSAAVLCLAHHSYYVEDVLSCSIPNGFASTDEAVNHSLLYTNGSFCMAAYHALKTRSVAVSPTSGFHHAHYGSGGAYCTFNGLMVAARLLQKRGLAKKIGIIDLDMHYGNGTDDIIGTLPEEEKPKHFTGGAKLRSATDVPEFFEELAEKLEWMKDCDVIFYQAGADPHIKDPLGGWMTTEQMAERDLMVFKACKAMNIGVAWNLAGGYQNHPDGTTNWPAILEIHNNTLKACWAVYGNAL